jgi:hypothetical protein
MKNRMKYYLSYYEELTKKSLNTEETAEEREKLLIQIQFFQHERLIHLIVTVLFALLTVITLFTNLFLTEPLLLVLSLLFFVLLIPYIKHYYLLENGVQKLYTYYDKLCE